MTDSKNKVHTDMLTEISIERMKQKNEMFVISGCRNRLVTRNKGQSLRDEFLAWKSAKRGTTIEEFLKEYNNAHDAELKKELDKLGCSYKKSYGGYTYGARENDPNDLNRNIATEKSYIVFADKKDGSKMTSEELFNLAVSLCKKYKQESVYIKIDGKNPAWYGPDGKESFSFPSISYDKRKINRDIYDRKAKGYTTIKRKKENHISPPGGNRVYRRQRVDKFAAESLRRKGRMLRESDSELESLLWETAEDVVSDRDLGKLIFTFLSDAMPDLLESDLVCNEPKEETVKRVENLRRDYEEDFEDYDNDAEAREILVCYGGIGRGFEEAFNTFWDDVVKIVSQYIDLAKSEACESRRPRGRMLKEERLDYMKTIPYTVRQYYNKYTKEWKPCIIYINSRDNGEWWIEWFDEWGTSEIGLDYGISRNGTNKCDPEEVKKLEDAFISDCKEYGNTPAKKVSRLGSVGRLRNYIGR